MVKAYIKINNFKDISNFHKAAQTCGCELVVQSGTKMLNPKSLMGIFNLETGKVLSLVARTDDKNEILEQFEQFLAV